MKTFIQFLVACLIAQAIVAQPKITFFTPNFGPVGTRVTIKGTNLGANPADNIVYFGATKATVIAASTTSLTVIVPSGATFSPITVTANNLTAYADNPFITTFNGGGLAFDSTSFAPKTDFIVGDPFGSNGVCIGDLDGDGKPELVVVDNKVNYDGNSIAVLKNISSPGITAFALKVDFITGLSPQSVTFGDVDGDGKPDLLVANYFDHSVSILRNTSTVGNISFDPKVDFDMGNGYSRNVAINDIDGDGKPDIAVGKGGNGFSLMRNTSTPGAISFDARIDYQIIVGAEKIALADMDGDHKPDIVTVYGKISTFRNISSPGFIAFDSKVDFSGIGYTFDIGDLNGDGKPDIVLGNATLKNNSTPGNILLAAPQSFESLTEPNDVTVGDLNGDGKPDIAVAGPNENTFAVIRNISEDTSILFAPKVGYKTTGFTWGIAMADLDGDGKTDMAADYDFGSPIPYAVSVFTNLMADNSCPLVTGLNVINITDSSAMIRWALPGTTVSSFKIRYRQVGTIPVFRKQVKGTRNNVKLDSLLPNKTYEWQVRSNCSTDTSAWVSGPNFTTVNSISAVSSAHALQVKTSVIGMIVSPNPGKGNFTLQMQLPAKAAATTIALYNSLGVKVWQQQAGQLSGAVTKSIALENKLATGVYVLYIERSDIKLVQKIVVSK